MAMRQEVNAPLILTVGAVGGVLTVVLMVGVHAWFLNEEGKEVAKKERMGEPLSLVHLRDQQEAKLKTAPVPIDAAMHRIAQNHGLLPADIARPATKPSTQPATRPGR
jgi:hypothetical protein